MDDYKGQFIIDDKAERKEFEKYANFTFLYDIWLKNIEDGKKISDYFTKRNHKTIAIYGMGMVGKHLLKQLNDKDVKVVFTIERNIASYNNMQYSYDDIKVIAGTPDVIVITPLLEFEKIKEQLIVVFDTEVVSVEEVILSL